SAEDLYSLCLLASETDQPILSDEIIKILSGRFPDSPESRLLAPPADGQAKVEAYPEPGSFMRASASLEEGPAPAPASYIQTGSFIKEKNARELMSGLAAKGFLPVLDLINRNGTVYYRVSVPIEPSLNRQTVLLQLKEAGFEAF
ncbi:MAG: SPOR domain-containing protein, partial [Spirochaetales bacterium]